MADGCWGDVQLLRGFTKAQVTSGRFEGTLNARGKLLIRSTGHLTGQIVYGQLEIELGGQLIGDVQVAGSAAPAGRKSVAASEEPRHEERAAERVAVSGESD